MTEVSIIGLDLAKRVFQVHGNDVLGKKLFTKQLTRGQLLVFFGDHKRCVVAMEACSSSHYWGREIAALGYEVRLIPAQYVKPFVKRQKSDAIDAEAICEAAVRPNMRFVAIKSAQQHGKAMVFRGRDLLVRQRTQLINAVRGHCAEFGITAALGNKGYDDLKSAIETKTFVIPDLAADILAMMVTSIDHLDEQIGVFDGKIKALAKADKGIKNLMSVPGVGPITALAVRALGPDPKGFASGRDYAAWMGLVPSQHSSGGKERLGKITKKGNATLRRLLVICAGAHITSVMRERSEPDPWLKAMLVRHPRMKVITALANKLARILWALQVKGGVYEAPIPA